MVQTLEDEATAPQDRETNNELVSSGYQENNESVSSGYQNNNESVSSGYQENNESVSSGYQNNDSPPAAPAADLTNDDTTVPGLSSPRRRLQVTANGAADPHPQTSDCSPASTSRTASNSTSAETILRKPRDLRDPEQLYTKKSAGSPRRRSDSGSPRRRHNSGSPRRRGDSSVPKYRRDSVSPRKRRDSDSPRRRHDSGSPRRKRGSDSLRRRRDSSSPRRWRDSSLLRYRRDSVRIGADATPRQLSWNTILNITLCMGATFLVVAIAVLHLKMTALDGFVYELTDANIKLSKRVEDQVASLDHRLNKQDDVNIRLSKRVEDQDESLDKRFIKLEEIAFRLSERVEHVENTVNKVWEKMDRAEAAWKAHTTAISQQGVYSDIKNVAQKIWSIFESFLGH